MPTRLISHYRVEPRLGAGEMGDVFLAEDTKLDRLVALKRLPKEVARDASPMKTSIVTALSLAMLLGTPLNPAIAADSRMPAAAAKRPMALADFFRFHRLSDPQLSPDGKAVVYVATDVLMEENRLQSDLWLAPLEGGHARQLTASLPHCRTRATRAGHRTVNGSRLNRTVTVSRKFGCCRPMAARRTS